ncbi:hypothetical protein [Paracoccus sp. (in: a-proteobacteria)]|uniref:hypothetical protein n=1 Tax=Paracoccus sp. TaxID=267 RepID=UPI0026DEBE68|nr:hypothetical protein [Paracoccus sp. (in: a-proteobacteria)]MDO5648155.1 hypothetical protein [Paracoccus sp. (in: a-proteobacteria)]
MQPAKRQPIHLIVAMMCAALLAGCAAGKDQGRPPAKPDEVTARMSLVAHTGEVRDLDPARISTRSGTIQILEADGSVTEMTLDDGAFSDPFLVTESQLAALNQNLTLDFSRTAAANLPRAKSAQEQAIEDFAARTQPALPVWRGDKPADADDFIAVRVDVLGDGPRRDLVEVTANLRQGVDADIAFSYATCALAAWADSNGTGYGRHVRTLQAKRNGKLLIGAAFTMSDQRPLGLRVMETKETLRECKARGIPAA